MNLFNGRGHNLINLHFVIIMQGRMKVEFFLYDLIREIRKIRKDKSVSFGVTYCHIKTIVLERLLPIKVEGIAGGSSVTPDSQLKLLVLRAHLEIVVFGVSCVVVPVHHVDSQSQIASVSGDVV